MGNNQPSNWREEFELVEGTGAVKRAVHRQSKERYEVLTLLPSSEEELQGLLGRIKLRAAKASPHLLPLHSFWRNSGFAPCNSRPALELIFKTATPLEEYLTLRKVKNQTFSKEEVEYIIARVAGGLSDIREMREEYGAVNLGTVFVDGEVKLKDPLLMKEDVGERKARRVQGFPSPQKLYTFFDTLSTFEEHTSDLFSLGILALQLIYPHQNLSGIYKNTNSRYLNCSIDANELRTFINGVQDHTLRRYVAVLTDEQPNKRREIYQLLKEKNISGQNLKILKENPFQIIHSEERHNPEKQASKLEEGYKLIEPAPRPPSQVVVPPHPTIRFDLDQRAKETQSFSFFLLQPAIPAPHSISSPPIFSSNQFKPAFVQPWRPSQIFESTYRNIREDVSESTPINKINGNASKSFKSPAFDFTFPKAPSNPPYHFSSYEFLEEGKTGKVSPKFIDATYRSSFIPGSPQIEIEPSKSIIVAESANQQISSIRSPLNNAEQTQTKQSSPQIQPSPPIKISSKRQLSPQLQVKTSVEVTDNPKVSLIQVINSESTQNVIKFESIPSKIVQSVNQIQRQLKGPSQKEGFVVEEYDIGTRYQGFKSNGMRNGQGQFIYKEGSKYKGEWKDNKMEGYGTLYYPNGAIAYEGQWLDDEFDGLGTVYNDTPTAIKGGFDYTNFNSLDEEWLKYEGQLKRDAKDGQGKLYLTNGELYTGMFENDLVHGEGEFQRYNGSVIKGLWQEGLLKKLYQ